MKLTEQLYKSLSNAMSYIMVFWGIVSIKLLSFDSSIVMGFCALCIVSLNLYGFKKENEKRK